MNAVYKFSLCILRRILKSDKLAAPIAGFLAGLTSIIDIKNRRKFLMILLLSRASDCTFNLAKSRGIARNLSYGELIVFFVSNIP